MYRVAFRKQQRKFIAEIGKKTTTIKNTPHKRRFIMSDCLPNMDMDKPGLSGMLPEYVNTQHCNVKILSLRFIYRLNRGKTDYSVCPIY